VSFSQRLQKAAKLPPRVLLARVYHKLVHRSRHVARRWQVRYFPARLSNADLLAATTLNLHNAAALAAHFRTRTSPDFFLSPESRKLLPRIFPTDESRAARLRLADDAARGCFDLLGSGPVDLGNDINWHTDFKTGTTWPPVYFADIDYSDLSQPYDVKVPWELSRAQHFVTLGQAYWLTGDEKYTRAFLAQWQSWQAANPPQVGVNWACTMDVAIRAVNWVWAFYFFKDSPAFTDDLLLAFVKSIFQHGQHILRNLEDGPIRGNHYLSDGVGLVYLGLLFPEFKEAARWRKKGLEILFGEMRHQVYPDGADFEASIPYHRLVLELFLSPILLCRRNGVSVPDDVLARLEKMFEFVLAYTKPDGTAPILGDADDGRLLRLSQPGLDREFSDHRYLLAIGAVLFNRADFGRAAGDCWEEALWLLGQRATEFRVAELPAAEPAASAHFPDAGIFVMRHAAYYLLLDAGPNGQDGNGGHAHNDLFSFELYAGDKSFIVDPGAYVYTADYRARNLFRSTAYHNTVQVDGREICPLADDALFTLTGDPTVTLHRWESTPTHDFLDVEHDGYRRLSQPVFHRRQLYFDKSAGWWIIRDLLTGDGNHQFELNFHLAAHIPELHFAPDNRPALFTAVSGTNLALVSLLPHTPPPEVWQGWVSPRYGVRQPAPVVTFRCAGEVPAEFVTALVPHPAPFPADFDWDALVEQVLARWRESPARQH